MRKKAFSRAILFLVIAAAMTGMFLAAKNAKAKESKQFDSEAAVQGYIAADKLDDVILKSSTSTITITYKPNGGSGSERKETVTKGANFKTWSGSTYSRDGYKLAGWALYGSASNASYTPGATAHFAMNVILYAVWKPAYKVTYDGNGGKNTPSAQIEFKGTSLTLTTATPYREGYNFTGWKGSDGKTYAKGAKYTGNANITMKAIWEVITYNVKLIQNDGTGSITTLKKQYAVALKLPSPTRSKYSFGGWKTSSGTVYSPGSSYTNNAAVELTAVWNPNRYTITYDGNGGTGATGPNVPSASQTFTYGSTVTINGSCYTKSGYTFVGWAKTKNSTTIDFAAGKTGVKFEDNITLYAVWKPNEYLVVFDMNDGSNKEFTRQTKVHGTNLTLTSSKPTRANYSFQGWATSASGSVLYGSGATYTNNSAVRLYAVWKPDEYTVSFNANGGSGAPSAQKKIYGQTLTLSPTKPTRTYYTFLGWATSSTATSATYSPSGAYKVEGTATLYAVWKPNTYTITYNGNGGTGATGANVPSASQNYVYGNAVTINGSCYTKSGYTFVGWATSSSATTANYTAGQTGVKFSGNVTLYAVWKANVYTIYLDMNDGSGTNYKSLSKTHGVNMTLPTTIPTRTNYEFLGWATSSSATTATYAAGATYTGNASARLYAVWKRLRYTISYNGNGGTGATGANVPSASQDYYAGNAVTINDSCYTKTGYTFTGWSTDKNATTATYTAGQTGVKFSGNVTLYAVWKANVYTIILDMNDGSGTNYKSLSKTHGVNLTLPTTKPTRTNYEFLGWSASSSATTATYAAGATYTGNATTRLYAVWKRIRYTITYDGNGGTGATGANVPSASQDFYAGNAVTINDSCYTKTGCTFIGWSLDKNATTATYTAGQTGVKFTGNTTLYAVWKTTEYIVVFDMNDGSNQEFTRQTKVHGTSLTLTSSMPKRTNYTFEGWATSATGSVVYASGASYTNNASVRLYAVWKLVEYNVTFNANGGSGAPATQKKIHGQTLTLSATEPKRTYYTFLGWATSSTATTATYSAGGSYTSNTAVTLYAVWKPNTYSISYNGNGGTGATGPNVPSASQTYVYGTPVTINDSCYTKTGCTFVGWSTDKNATSATYTAGQTGVKFSGDVILYAVWKTNEYTIFLDMNDGSGKDYKSLKKMHGTSITLPTTIPERTYYEFLGWATSSSATTATYAAGATYTGNASTRLYAVWKRIRYTISYNGNGGTGATGANVPSASQEFLAGNAVTINDSCYTKTGCTFIGWSTNKNATTATYTAGQTGVKFDGNTTLYAVWKTNEYTIFLDMNDGSGKDYTSLKKLHGTSITLPTATPERTYYEFLGWATSSSATTATYAAGATYTGNSSARLYAVWKRIRYTITYDGNGGTGATGPNVPSASQEFYAGTTVTINDSCYTKTGRTFIGWSTNKNATSAAYTAGQSGVKFDGDITLYAVWKTNEYTIFFDMNDGSGKDYTSLKKLHGTSITLPETAPERTYYEFLGWATSSSATTATYAAGATYTGNSSARLYAVWKRIKYTIIYDGNGGTGATGPNVPSASQEFYAGTTVTINDSCYTKTGCTFIGWSTNKNATSAAYTAGQTGVGFSGNITLYAVWKPTEYLVVFDMNDGSNREFTRQNKIHGTDLTLPTSKPSRSNYTFKGWAASSNGTVKYQAGDIFKENKSIRLYAVWEPNKYTITYNLNGGIIRSGEETQEVSYGIETQLIAPDCSKDGSKLLGWTDDRRASAVKYENGKTYTFYENTELYAVWKKYTVSVTYDGKEGTTNEGSNSFIIVYSGDTITLSPAVYTKKDYAFQGWTDESYSSTAKYKAGEQIPCPLDDTTMYAVWKPIFTIKYTYGDETRKLEYCYQKEIELSNEVFAREGYDIVGWTWNKDKVTDNGVDIQSFFEEEEIFFIGKKYEFIKDLLSEGTSWLIFNAERALESIIPTYDLNNYAPVYVEKYFREIELYPIWKKQDYPITASVHLVFNDGDNTIGEKLYGSTDHSKVLHYDVLEKGGKRLLGWALRPNQKYADFLDDSVCDISQFREEGTVNLYAVWRDVETFIIRFKADDKVIFDAYPTGKSTYIRHYYLEGSRDRSDYVIDGWRIEQDPNNEMIEKTPVIYSTEEVVFLEAVWKLEFYNVSFTSNYYNLTTNSTDSFCIEYEYNNETYKKYYNIQIKSDLLNPNPNPETGEIDTPETADYYPKFPNARNIVYTGEHNYNEIYSGEYGTNSKDDDPDHMPDSLDFKAAGLGNGYVIDLHWIKALNKDYNPNSWYYGIDPDNSEISFIGWATDPDNPTKIYRPGEPIDFSDWDEEYIDLYAIWGTRETTLFDDGRPRLWSGVLGDHLCSVLYLSADQVGTGSMEAAIAGASDPDYAWKERASKSFASILYEIAESKPTPEDIEFWKETAGAVIRTGKSMALKYLDGQIREYALGKEFSKLISDYRKIKNSATPAVQYLFISAISEGYPESTEVGKQFLQELGIIRECGIIDENHSKSLRVDIIDGEIVDISAFDVYSNRVFFGYNNGDGLWLEDEDFDYESILNTLFPGAKNLFFNNYFVNNNATIKPSELNSYVWEGYVNGDYKAVLCLTDEYFKTGTIAEVKQNSGGISIDEAWKQRCHEVFSARVLQMYEQKISPFDWRGLAKGSLKLGKIIASIYLPFWGNVGASIGTEVAGIILDKFYVNINYTSLEGYIDGFKDIRLERSAGIVYGPSTIYVEYNGRGADKRDMIKVKSYTTHPDLNNPPFEHGIGKWKKLTSKEELQDTIDRIEFNSFERIIRRDQYIPIESLDGSIRVYEWVYVPDTKAELNGADIFFVSDITGIVPVGRFVGSAYTEENEFLPFAGLRYDDLNYLERVYANEDFKAYDITIDGQQIYIEWYAKQNGERKNSATLDLSEVLFEQSQYYRSVEEYNEEIDAIYSDTTKTNQQKVEAAKQCVEKLNRSDLGTEAKRNSKDVPSDARAVANPDYSDWSKGKYAPFEIRYPDANSGCPMGLDIHKEIMPLGRGEGTLALPDVAYRYGNNYNGYNYTSKTENGKIPTLDERAVPKVYIPEKDQLMHFDTDRYFDVIDAIRLYESNPDGALKELNRIIDEMNQERGTQLVKATASDVSCYYVRYTVLQEGDFATVRNALGCDEEFTIYGVHGYVAPLLGENGEVICCGGADQYNTALSQNSLHKIGVIY